MSAFIQSFLFGPVSVTMGQRLSICHPLQLAATFQDLDQADLDHLI